MVAAPCHKIMGRKMDPLYFKSYLINAVHAVLVIVGLIILLYNLVVKRNRLQAGLTNRIAYYTFALLFIPIIVDSVFDIVTEYKSIKMTNVSMIIITAGLVLTTAFNALYFVSYMKIYKLCTANYQLILERDDDADEKVRRRRDWSGFFNVYLFINLIGSLLFASGLLLITFIMRLWTSNDHATNLETDLSVWAALAAAIHIPFIIVDYLYFHCYTGPVIMPYFLSAFVALGMMMNFYNTVDASERVTMILFFITIGLAVLKYIAFNEIGPKHMLNSYKKRV